MDLQYSRPDGSFVALVNGLPYHITADDALYVEAQEIADGMGDELLSEPVQGQAPVNNEAVNAERDRRISAGFVFSGKLFDFDDKSKQRVTGAATLAGFAIADGAQPGDYLWHGGSTDFTWIAKDNTLVVMDAQTCFAFGQAAAAHESKMIFCAYAIKQLDPIPDDFADDEYWS